jgi:hypothetical protein
MVQRKRKDLERVEKKEREKREKRSVWTTIPFLN